MAFKLTQAEAKRRDELVEALQKAQGELDDAVSEYNEKSQEIRGPVEEAVSAYNAVVEEAHDFAEDVASDGDTAFDEKSEKWQEGERGEAARSWIDEWQNADFNEIEINWPDDLEIEAPGHAGNLEALPTEAE